MRKVLLAAVLLGLGFISDVGLAIATDQSAAIELCKKNPQCVSTKTTETMVFSVPGSEISCPNDGSPCVCLMCTHPKREGVDLGYVIRPQMNAPQSLSDPGPSGPAPAAPVRQPPPIL